MSSQLDEPYTRITNEILEEIAKRPFNGSQYAIIITILRNTYGFQRKCHGISLTYIAEATNTNRNQVKRELDKLIEMKVIKVYSDGSYTSSREIGFNKYFSEWQLEDCTLKRVHPSKKSTVRKKEHREDPKTSTGGVRELESQERKKDLKEIPKENSTTRDDFETVRVRFRELHGLLDLPYNDSPILSKLLSEGIPREVIIGVMESRFKPTVRTIKYYEAAIRETHHRKSLPQAAGGEAFAQYRRSNPSSDDYYEQLRGLSTS